MDRKLSHERGLVQEDCDELIDADELNDAARSRTRPLKLSGAPLIQ